jgi:hypothetical protein
MIEVLKQMQEALRKYHYYTIDAGLPNQSMLNKGYAAYQAGKKAIKELESQEPIAWVAEDICKGQQIDGRPRKIWWECEKGVGTAFYAHPPQRTWVDLTRTQIQDVYFAVLEEHRGGHQMEGQLAFGEALQAKIREKNT